MPNDQIDATLTEFLDSEMGKPDAPATPETPPVETPPVEAAQEVDTPPIETPPAEEPAVETPPVAGREKELLEDNENLRKLLNEFAAGQAGAAYPAVPAGPGGSSSLPTGFGGSPSGAGGATAGVLEAFLTPDVVKAFAEKINKDEVYLTQEELDSLVDNPSVLQGALNKARRSGAQTVVETLPYIVMKIVTDFTAVRDSVKEFYDTHADLVPHKPFVSFMHKRVRENPEYKNKSSKELLDITAKEARKTLRLAEPSQSVAGKPAAKPTGGKPAFGGVRGGSSGGKPVQKEAKPSGAPTQLDYIADVLKGM